MIRFNTIGCTASLVAGLAVAMPHIVWADLAPTTVAPEALTVTEIAGKLEHPWGLAFLPDNNMLVTERPGRLRVVSADGVVGSAVRGVPQVAARGQGGLLDVIVSPSFAEDRLVYLSYAEAGDGKLGTAVGRGKLSKDMKSLENFTVIFRQSPKLSAGNHFGSRMVFDQRGHLFVTLGENNERAAAQDLDKHQGKVIRINADGSVPKDNPFVGRADVLPEIWTYGQRNPQGMAINPATGEVWTSEHGPRGGDEVNIAQPGKNYGWPLATHGINYSGQPIPEAKGEHVEGTEKALYVWRQSPAISGMVFYAGDKYPAWRNAVFFGALSSRDVIRLTLNGKEVVAEERMLGNLSARIRDVRIGPDQALYVLTDSSDGKLLRVTPR